MNLFMFVGGELVDPMIPESMVEFHFSIFAKTQAEAVEAFNEIFPGCSVIKCSLTRI